MVAIFTGSGAGLERGSGNVLGGSGLLGSAASGRGGEQLFLNAANGNLILNHQDEMLLGRGPDAAISRTYNSLGNYTDENGDNWRQSTDRRIFAFSGSVNNWGSTVKRRSADGSETSYAWNGSVYVATDGAGSYDTLSYNGAWTWRDGDSQITETYQAYGADWRITSQQDVNGNVLSFGYSGDKLVQLTTADGGTIQYGWSGNTITSIVTSSQGTVLTRTRYGYDGYNRLATVTVDLTPNDNSVGDGNAYTTSYSYYGASTLVSAIVQSDGSRTDITYDGANRVASLVQTVASGVTRTTALAYGAGYTIVTDPAGQQAVLYYDGNGALTQITAPPASSGAPQQVVQFGYNGNGDLVSVTDPAGNATSYGYDGWGNVVSQTDRLGNAVSRTYNAANQILTETSVGSDKDSAAAYHTTRYVYDGAGRLRYTVSAEGRVSELRYGAYGVLASTIEYRGQVYDVSGLAPGTPLGEGDLNAWVNAQADPSANSQIQYGYDARGALSQKISYGGSYNPYAPHTANGYTHEYFTYDQAGQLLAKVVAGQNWENYVYDGLGRLTAKTDVNGNTTSFVFNDAATQTVVTLSNGFVQTSTYNKAGELVSFTESGAFVAGGTASRQYDRDGRLRIATDASGVKIYYLYDKVGRKIAEINDYGWVSEYRYDANDRLVATVQYALGITGGGGSMALLADPNSNVEMAAIRPAGHSYDLWSWTVYDKEGRTIETIEGDGSVTAYDYDASGRLVKSTAYATKLAGWQIASFQSAAPTGVVLPGASATDAVSRVFYDKDGKTIGALDGEGYLSRIVYDAAGRKVQDIAYANPTYAGYRASGSFQQLINSAGVSGDDRSTRYVYDQQDNLRFTIDGLGHVLEYGYEYSSWMWSAFGVVRSTTQYAGTIGALSSYTYESVKSAVAGLAGNPANRTSWSVYDDSGRVAYSIDAAGAVTGYAYDALGHVVKAVQYANLRSTSSLPSKGDMDGWAAGSASGADRVTRYYYSARGELRFTIDAEGYVTRNDYDAGGRLTFTARWDTAVAAADWWDIYTVNGAVSGNWAGQTNQYDASGRLTVASDGEGHFHRYYYYANGTLAWDIRMEGWAEDSRTLFVYDAVGRVIAQYDAYGTAEQSVTQYAYDGLGNLASTTDALGRTTSFTYDHAGRKLTETDALGGVTSAAYDAFGDVVRSTDKRGNSTYSFYDKLGRVVLTRDAEDYVSETAYTAFGEVASTTRRYNKAVNGAGIGVWPAYSGHANDATAQFQYDKLGRLVTATDAEGYYEQYTLNAFGDRVSTRNKLGGVTTSSYDRRGLLVSETMPVASVDRWGNTTASSVTNRYDYDSRGNRTSSYEAYGLAEQRHTWYVYDKANRLIETHADSIAYVDQSNHSGFGYTDLVERNAYDARGNLIETVDGNGARTLFYYDDLDRKIAELSAVGTLSTFSYDVNDNLTAARVWGTAIGQPGSAGGTPPGVPGGEYRETSYSYDALNRMTSSSIAALRTGAWNGSSFTLSYAPVTTSYTYDAMGNVVATTDANGGIAYAYYDRLGRAVAQVDQQGYAIRWTLDANGNTLEERRYATQTSGASTAGQPWIPDSGADRVTGFGYDRMGRRTAEYRYNVEAYATNGAGQLYWTGGTAAIYYSYNGLGQVTRKTEATGDYVDYGYDAGGRLIQETRAAYIDQTGNWVRPTVRYAYDGLNDLTQTRQGAETPDGSDRITRYSYGARGRLASMTDASGADTAYYYDAAGNIIRQNYARTKSDGSSAYEGLLYTRDVLGRVTSQTIGVWNGSWWMKGDIQNIAYNAYGEVAQRGLNGGWQEQFAYDGMGQLYRSNSSDGVWRYYIHDGNGNQTAVVESEGSWIGGQSLDGAISGATYGFAYGLGQVYIDGINVAINMFDRRGQAIQTRLTQRQLSETGGTTDLVASRGYNAFGEVAWETDARGSQTSYGYNTMGRTTYIQRAAVLVTNTDGSQAWVNPVEHIYYDLSGRVVGADDANGSRTTRQLLAGSGHGSEAMVVYEWHADGGVVHNGYDRFGDLRRVTDEIGRTTGMDYDGMGRLVQLTRPSGQADYYAYDVLGQRIRHWNSWYGSWNAETIDYDQQGRVVRAQALGGDVTTTSYSWSGGISTSGLGTYGGWVQTTTYANGRSATEYSDMFGHTTYSSDLGGHGTWYSYDLAARLIQRSGGETVNYNYLNSGLLGSMTSGYGSAASAPYNVGETYQLNKTSYAYDAGGNRIAETYTVESGGWTDYGYWDYYDPYYGYYGNWISNWQYSSSSTTYENATASYDALGRMTGWNESGNQTTPAASIAYSYDAVGNVRRSYATYRSLDANGNASGYANVQDYWYRYDSMNRVVTAKGQLIGGQVQRGYQGTDIAYNLAGERAQSTRTVSATAQVYDPYAYYDPYYGYYNQYYYTSYDADSREDYTYDADGHLATVSIAQSGYYDNWDGTITVTAPGAGELKANYAYDGMGRLTHQVDYLYGSVAAYDSVIYYNDKGQAYYTVNNQRQGGDTITTYSSTDYGYGSNYALGAAVSTGVSTYKNGSYQSYSTTANNYVWYGGAVQSTVTYTQSGQATQTSYFYYSASGQLTSTYVADGRPHTITFTNDMNGQAIRRDESDYNYSLGDPHEVWYRFGGKQLGYVGNNGTLNTDYQTSIYNRTTSAGTGAYQFGASYGSAYADFDQNFNAITSYSQGSAGGAYTVRRGDTLPGIAAALWGDSSLWYLIAEANGITAAGALTEGQTLTIPSGVQRNAHNASTFRPYDANAVLGDTSPTTPQPQRVQQQSKNGCGVFGAILLVVIAVAVTVITAGAAAAALAPGISSIGAGITALAAGTTGLSAGALIGIGAAAGAMGSIVSQGVGVATGIQDSFSWKSVALAGLAGGVSAGLGASGLFGGIKSAFVQAAAQGAAASLITQGIAVATGLQDKFDWAGVAAAGIGGGVGAWAGSRLHLNSLGDMSAKNIGGHLVANAASSIANAATRSVIDGTDFGDNIIASLPDVLGSLVAGLIQGGAANAQKRQEAGDYEATNFVKMHPNATPEQIEAARQEGITLFDASRDYYRPQGIFESDEHFKARQAEATHAVNIVRRAHVALAAAADGVQLTDAQLADARRASRRGYNPAAYDQQQAAAAAPKPVEVSVVLEEVVVTATIPDEALPTNDGGSAAIIARPVDTAIGWIGEKANAISDVIENRWWLKYGLEAAGVAADAAAFVFGGPIPLLIDKALGSAKSKASAAVGGLVTDRFAAVGYDNNDASMAGAGGATLMGLVLESGNIVALVKSVPSLISGFGARLRSMFSKAPEPVSIPSINGRKPINSKYAGDVHPSGVRFNEQGFPDFSPWAKAEVKVQGLTGVYKTDEALANAAVNLKKTPTDYVWHHVEDGTTMQLIPKSIHNAARHTGGAAVIKNGGFDK